MEEENDNGKCVGLSKGIDRASTQTPEGSFVRLAGDGDKVTGVFCGEPYAREVIWTGERYETYDAKNPAHQVEGKRSNLRVSINLFVLPEGAMKIIEGGT